MATKPMHVKIAAREGALAGLESLYEYLDRNTVGGTAGLDTNRAVYAEIRKAGSNKLGKNFKLDKAVGWYCNKLSEKFGIENLPMVIEGVVTTPARSTQTEQVVESNGGFDLSMLSPAQLAALSPEQIAAIAGATNGNGEQEVEIEATPAVETVEQAAPKYVPKNPDQPATNGKLWTVNSEGPEHGYFLAILDGEGNVVAGGDSPLTNIECHNVIAEIRA